MAPDPRHLIGLLPRLLGLAGWTRPSFFVTPPALRTARETIAAVPDMVKAVLVLPTMVEQLERIGRDTSVLPEMRDEFVVVRSTVVRMQADTDKIAAQMPTLVVLEQSLPAMVPMLEDLDQSVHRLADVVEPLHGAARRVGRLSDRLPQRNGR